MSFLFQEASFYTSAHQLKDLPLLQGVEIAFAGRSNSGKSSVINTLTGRKKLAFVSKTPGRTQLINYFRLNSELFLVDLPGYGYAKVPHQIRKHWEIFLSTYLQTRESLLGLVLIIDARHPLKELDLQMLDWFAITQKSVHIILTKSDKLSKQQASTTLQNVKAFLEQHYPFVTVQLFSSTKRIGVEEINRVIKDWLNCIKIPEEKNSNYSDSNEKTPG